MNTQVNIGQQVWVLVAGLKVLVTVRQIPTNYGFFGYNQLCGMFFIENEQIIENYIRPPYQG